MAAWPQARSRRRRIHPGALDRPGDQLQVQAHQRFRFNFIGSCTDWIFGLLEETPAFGTTD